MNTKQVGIVGLIISAVAITILTKPYLLPNTEVPKAVWLALLILVGVTEYLILGAIIGEVQKWRNRKKGVN